MKQLLQATDHAVLCALNERAFLVLGETTIELTPPPFQGMDPDTHDTQPPDDRHFQAIQAVAIMETGDSVWCAVSRFNKSLALYQLPKSSTQSPVAPTTVQTTTKRAGCLTFAIVPDEANPLTIIIAGDLAGDATAFPLDNTSNGRLLLGHTASMLTGVRVVGNTMLTSDRDEKVRTSEFPNTMVVKGYFLGHTAFVSCMDVAASLCVTCGGDSTVRLWDIKSCKELCKVETAVLPTRVALCENETLVAVIYEGVSTLDLYHVNDSTMTLIATKECAAQPLSVVFRSITELLVIAGEPEYLLAFSIQQDKLVQHEDTFVTLKESAKEIKMPTSVMETDKNGVIKLQKLSEERGPAKEKPWNRVGRIQTSKEGNARRSKKRRQAEIGASMAG